MTEDEMDGITDNINEFEQAPGAGDGQGGLPCCGSWGRKESDMTERLTELNTLAWGFPGGARGREPSSQCRRHKRHGFDPWVRKIEKENGNPLQYSCLENSLDRGA